MNKNELADFLGAWGEEFSLALCPPVGDDLICPQDAYEVWLRAFRKDPSPKALTGLTEEELAQLHAECVRYFDCPAITPKQLRTAISRTLYRWPDNGA